ncbi:MAG: zinc ABC transporter substrate-binding protein, partial [Candidatus Babeliales bacterium]
MQKNSIITVIIIILVSFFMYKTMLIDDAAEKKHTLTIVCTTSMITDIVKTIVGDTATVYGLMGPGIDPHLYRARESDVAKLEAADIIFYNGLHLEGKMAELFEKMAATKTTVGVADNIPKELLLESDFAGHYDPHIWFDVSLWAQVARSITNTLCAANQKDCPAYQERAQIVIDQLIQLDSDIRRKIQAIPQENRILVTAHDAFSYFGRRYGFEVHGLQGISTESEAGAKDVKNLVNLIVKKRVHAIFVESSI